MKFSLVTLVTLVACVATATAQSFYGENSSSRPRDRDFEGKLRGRSPPKVRAHHDFEDHHGRSHFEGGGTAVANPRAWTGHTTDGLAPASCGNSLVNGMHCSGDYCDDSTLRCSNDPDDVFKDLTPTKTIETHWFSEDEGGGQAICKDSNNNLSFMTSLYCDGSYCDWLKLECKVFEEVKNPKETECHWTGHKLSEENNQVYQNTIWTDPGYYVSGVKCEGRYCDVRELYVCKARLKDNLSTEPAKGNWNLANSYNGNVHLKYTYHWSLSQTNSEITESEAAAGIQSTIKQAFEYQVYGVDGSTEVEVTGSYSETVSHSVAATLSKDISETLEASYDCFGKLYQWAMSSANDSNGGIGWSLSSNHAVCIPFNATFGMPNCPPGECADIHCQVCKCTFVRDLMDQTVDCDANGSYI